jgi:hypothetical protein
MAKPEIDTTLQVVEHILREMGRIDLSSESILADADAPDGDVLLRSKEDFGGFIAAFSIQMGCMPYPLDTVAGLTVGQFCELCVSESYPAAPETALEANRYTLSGDGRDERATYEPQEFPICFVLGAGRSGTTLFRSMLNVHEQLWAPGELHLAQFDTMADRAEGAGPFLRHALVPEASSRLGESKDAFSERLTEWEQDALPIPDVYRHLHDADPERLIIDKTPTYSGSSQDLDWITNHFPNARFVHIVRNPYDVIRSFVRMQFRKLPTNNPGAGLNPHHAGEIAWFRHNSNIAALFETLPADRTFVVRFEDLVADPATTLAEVCRLVGVSYEPRMANPYETDSRRVARGAGDPRVNLLTGVEQREPAAAFYPLGEQCAALAAAYGY